MSFCLRTSTKQAFYPDFEALQQLPLPPQPLLAFQESTSPALILHLLACWIQGKTILTLDPKLPASTVRELLLQESITHCTVDTSPDFLARHANDSPPSPQSQRLSETFWQAQHHDMPMTLIRTSGSTGEPKLAQHSRGNHYWSAQGSRSNIPLTTQDRWLLSLPLYHVGGLAILMRCWLAGATVLIPATSDLSSALNTFQPTHLSLVPTQLRRLLRVPDHLTALTDCKAILLGGAPVTHALIDTVRDIPVHTSYGSTEMSSQITTTPPGYFKTKASGDLEETHRPTASGQLLPHRELRLHEGEIQVRGKTLFQGYRHRGIVECPLDKGWFSTRDQGEWRDGQLYITGRRDNQFISGGENIQPEEIERHLLQLPGVSEAIVVPVPDPEFGMRPVAFVGFESLEASTFTARCLKLQLQLEKQLPRFKIPRTYHPWPTQNSLKPGRKKLQATALMLR